MGAKVVRVGLLEQPQVAKVLNERFVPIEFDATDGIPADVPALWFLRKVWDEIPYTRVSFGGEMVMDPTGEVLLSPGYSKHPHNKKNSTVAELFEEMLQDGLRRFELLQGTAAGTPEREVAVARIAAEVDGDIQAKRACALDVDFFTSCTLDTLGRSDPTSLEEKVCGLFTWQDPDIRVKLATTLGRYLEKQDPEYRGSPAGKLLRARLGALLDDEVAPVRRAAAVALYQFEHEPVPEGDDAVLIPGARQLLEREGP